MGIIRVRQCMIGKCDTVSFVIINGGLACIFSVTNNEKMAFFLSVHMLNYFFGFDGFILYMVSVSYGWT